MPTPYPQVSPSPDIIAILTEIILKNNHLSFLDRNVLKPVVTATETRPSSNPPPPLRTIRKTLRGSYQRNSLGSLYLGNQLFEKILIEKKFLIFLSTTKRFQSMKDCIKTLHPTINFIFGHSIQETCFLDIKTNIGVNCKISTILHRKPTNNI